MRSACRMHVNTVFALVIGLYAGVVASTPPAEAASVRARAAHMVTNRTGVAAHFGWTGSVYDARYDEVKAALEELGVRHVREALGNTEACARHLDLMTTLGVKMTLGIDVRTGTGASQRLVPSGIQPELDRAASLLDPDAILSFEGPNEYNMLEREFGHSGWASELRAFQSVLYSRVKAHPVLGTKPVLAPSLADPAQEDYHLRLGNLTSMTDRGNLHVYAGPRSIASKIDELVPFNALSNPEDTIWISEVGYDMALNNGKQDVIDEYTYAKYAARGMVAFATHPKVDRGYFYNLVDVAWDPTRVNTDAWYGMLDNRLNRRPHFYAVRNTMWVMCDNRLRFAPQTLSYRLSGNLSDVRSSLYQKNNRAFYLLIWQEKQSYAQGQRVINPARTITLTFEEGVSLVRTYLPSDPDSDLTQGHRPKRTVTAPVSIDLTVGDHLQVVEIVPDGVPAPTLPAQCRFTAF